MLHKITKTYKLVEPFVHGTDKDIKTQKQVLEVINKNLYYMYVVAGLFLTLFVFSLYLAVTDGGYPNPTGLIIGGLFLSLSFLVKKYMSQIASYALLTLSILLMVYVIYLNTISQSLGLKFLFAAILVASSLRIKKAIIVYHKLTQEHNKTLEEK